jgi:hypothetical protein
MLTLRDQLRPANKARLARREKTNHYACCSKVQVPKLHPIQIVDGSLTGE